MKAGRSPLESGFAIVELLAIVAMVGVLLAFAVPSMQGSLQAYRLSASANIIASELDAARVLAVSRGTIYEIVFDSTAGGVRVVDPNDLSHPPRAMKRIEKGVRFHWVPVQAIQFFPRGHARGGNVILRDDQGDYTTISVNAGGNVKVVHGSTEGTTSDYE